MRRFAALITDMTSKANDRTREKAGLSAGGQFATEPKHESAVVLDASSTPVLLGGTVVAEYRPEALTHVGSLDRAAKGSWSLEGQGLSVSRHPEAWGRIARIGGPIWTIGTEAPRFLDFHELTDEQTGALIEWGIDRGYVERKPAWRVTTWDEELDCERWTIHVDETEAAEEAEWSEGEVSQTTSVVATEAFPDATVKAGATDVEELFATVWVQEEATAFDGVWWEDDYDPVILSAPRGVIVPRAIAAWVASARPFDGRGADVEDEG